jgi:hypothetical protein
MSLPALSAYGQTIVRPVALRLILLPKPCGVRGNLWLLPRKREANPVVKAE